MPKSQVTDVVLIGGSSSIKYIQEKLEEMFPGKIRKNIDPRTAVATGAAIQAAIIKGEQSLKDISVDDVIPLTLVVNVNGKFSEILKKNTKIPTENKKQYEPQNDYDQEVRIEVYEGESENLNENHYLGDIILPVALAKKDEKRFIDVKFSINENGILYVSALDIRSGCMRSIKINNNSGRLSENERERLRKIEIEYQQKKEMDKQRLKAMDEFNGFCNECLIELRNKNLSNNKKDKIKMKISEMKDWIKNNQNKEPYEYVNKKKHLENEIKRLEEEKEEEYGSDDEDAINEEEERRRQQENEERTRQQEEERTRQQEEERTRQQENEERTRQQENEERTRQQENEERTRQQENEERTRQQEEERTRQQEEERTRQQENEERRRQQENEERTRQQENEERTRQQENEERTRQQEEERTRQQEEERTRQQENEERRRQQENEERTRQQENEERTRQQEEERTRQQEEERTRQQEEERTRQQENEERTRQQENEERTRQQEEEKKGEKINPNVIPPEPNVSCSIS
ncbi:hypothetical protein GPJ56_009424 [Histomonas meleagridis]|nr:hypothetical protein GPJ56_009424 [Histomonas meleagridis]